jgi:Domain of unknown function (DUF2382)
MPSAPLSPRNDRGSLDGRRGECLPAARSRQHGSRSHGHAGARADRGRGVGRERVESERVPVGRIVDAIPPVPEEGDTTVMAVVEEVVVIERQLVLKQEIRIRRRKTP